ncbi:hypothetical protein MTO96_029702 [Rhipicephalus appendiculatus]
MSQPASALFNARRRRRWKGRACFVEGGRYPTTKKSSILFLGDASSATKSGASGAPRAVNSHGWLHTLLAVLLPATCDDDEDDTHHCTTGTREVVYDFTRRPSETHQSRAPALHWPRTVPQGASVSSPSEVGGCVWWGV